MRVLVFAPHNDDEVLGVGGTIAMYSRQGHEVYVCEVTSGPEGEKVKLIQREALKAHRILGVKQTFFLGLPVVGLRDIPVKEINHALLQVVEAIRPDVAYIPHKGDMHVDHFEVAQSAMVALRPVHAPQLQAIYAYETLSETEWNVPTADNIFVPNTWSDITETIDDKLRAMQCYKSQLMDFPHPRSLEAIEALSKVRGSTICVENAECFMLIRGVLGFLRC